jgi:hypothetical protein
MKYRYTTILVILLATAVSLTSAQKISGGLKAGINLASWHGDDVEDMTGGDLKRKLGFCGGGFIAFRLGKVVILQPEVLYSQKGARQREEFLDEVIKVWYKLNYLEIPICIKLMIPVQGKVKPNLFLGPYFGVMITDPRGKVEIDGLTMEEDLEGVKDTDFGMVLGGGVDIGLGKGKMVFDVRYTLGLTTIIEYELFEENIDLKNNAFSFLLGYSF